MSRLIPMPTDVFKRVDDLIADVKPILVEVDTTLMTVSARLADVEETLGQATATLNEATAVLTEVKGLLGDLETKLEILDEVPAMKRQLGEVHSMLTQLTGDRAKSARPGKAAPTKRPAKT